MGNNPIVGILSMQRILNYGSFLQAYALKQLLLRSGAKDVHFLDIRPGRILPGYEPSTNIGRAGRALKTFLTGHLATKIRDLRFDKKMRASIACNLPTLGLDKPCPNEFDTVVIGSDEVFNCCQVSPWGYTSQLYGNIPEAKKVISYAGSFGHTTYGQLIAFGIDQEIGKTMKTMAAISVRDENSYEIVEKITGIKPEIHLDPVLIYGYKDEIAQRNISYPDKYMIIYSYEERINDQKEIEAIVKFARSKGLRLISIFCRYDWCDEAVIPDTPFDVLAWFKGAEYIVSDTFHGTIFSIITQKQFITLVRDSNVQKINSLLNILKLSDREVNDPKDICYKLKKELSYKATNDILVSERTRSIAYLSKNM